MVEEGALKILRSVNRRGSGVASVGWFIVLKSNPWFAASRLRDDFYHLGGRPKPTARTDTQNLTTPSLDVKLNANDPSRMRLALTILGAIAIASALLWSLVSQAQSTNYQ